MSKRRVRRRGNHEGCIFRRSNGTWFASITVKKIDGTNVRKTRKAESQEHAVMRLAELKAEFAPGKPVATRMTVADLMERWISTARIDASTLDGYRRAIDKRIVPFLGAMKCSDVTMMTIEDWLKELPADLGQRSKQMAFEVLSYAFNYGVRRQIVTFSPCDPELKPEVTVKEIRPFTDEEISKILKQVKGHRLEALHHLAFGIGARQGELFGLQWRDIDWTAGTVRIERQAKELKGKVIIKAPKTASSCRTVNLPPSVIKMLRSRQKLALKEQRAKPTDFIFPSAMGHVMRRNNFYRRHWMGVLKSTKITHRGHHHVRHTAATKLLRLGNPVHVVAHILGHASPTTTHRIYSHYIPADGQVASTKMSEELQRLIS